MPAPLYNVNSPAIALTASQTKTHFGIKAHANSGLLLKKLGISFDGVSASMVPPALELCYATFATNAPGTNSTSITPAQGSGRVMTAGFTAGYTWSSEPTVLTVLENFYLTPNSSTLWYDVPLAEEYDCALGEGFALRFVTPASTNPNVRVFAKVSRC